VQALFTQQPPLAQRLPAQHALPAPPQGTQVPAPVPLHTVPAVPQARFAQQVWPLPPHARHTPPLHIDELAVQVSPAQHASPSAPQLTGASAVPPSDVLVRVLVDVAVGAVDVVVRVSVAVDVPVVVPVPVEVRGA